MNILLKILTRLKEPSSVLGTVVTAVGGAGIIEALNGTAEQAPAGIASADFATALGVVIAGILAFILKEKGDK